MIKRFSIQEIDEILDGDRHARAAMAKLEHAGLKRDRWLSIRLLAIANAPYQSEWLKRQNKRAKSLQKVWLVPVMNNPGGEPDDCRAVPDGIRWNDGQLRALPDKLVASADQIELSLHNSRVETFLWLDPAFARHAALAQQMREFANALREALSHRVLKVRMDSGEHARALLDVVKRQTGGCHYNEIADILRPIYAAAGLDSRSEGWPTADSLKMLSRRGKAKRKRFVAGPLRHLGPTAAKR